MGGRAKGESFGMDWASICLAEVRRIGENDDMYSMCCQDREEISTRRWYQMVYLFMD